MDAKVLWIATLFLAGCVATPPGPPEQVAPKIVASLDSGHDKEAEELFEASASEENGSDLLYPLLYEEARGRYQKSDSASSARVLRFMAKHYPRSQAVREALVYALFLDRAKSEPPAPELVKEIGAAVGELRKSETTPPVWIGLVEAQIAIDRGEPSAARQAFTTFKKSWDGRPAELAVYVEDIDRYLISHP